jgi:alkylation response protein AidB-like acyl-CoA dehydrogenase
MHLLQFERGMWAWQRQAILHQLLETHVLGSESNRISPARLGRVYAQLSTLRVRCRDTVSRLAEGALLGPEVSVDKILLSRTEQQVHDLCREVAGKGFAMGDDTADRQLRADWFYSRAASVYGGAVEIQKNILAARVLHLPQEAKP